MSFIRTILVISLVLSAVEGMAHWWMHPTPAGIGDPVLVYRPSEVNTGKLKEDEQIAPVSPNSTSQPFSVSGVTSYTPLPEIVAYSIPQLRCSTGKATRIDRDDGVTIYLAFFAWDLADSTNVLEAFKHLPDECMGSIGMTLTAKHPPRSYVVRGQKSGNGGQGTGNGEQESRASNNEPLEKWRSRNGLDRAQRSQTGDENSSSSSLSTINSQPSTSSSETLTFDHTTFLDPAGVVVHAFKGTWVSGAADLLGPNVRGGADQWRQIRWKSALKRFNPAYARVAQGAVRGIPNPDLAWKIFEESMLVDLKMER